MGVVEDALDALARLREAGERGDEELRVHARRGELAAQLDKCQELVLNLSMPAALWKPGKQLATTTREKRAEDINVLVVDDDEVACMLLCNQLTKLKIRNQYVTSGEEALQLLIDDPGLVQLVLCDVNMPGLDGGEVLVRVLSDPQLRNIPIVMVSSDGDLEKARALVNAGAREYIVKPVKTVTLLGLSFNVKAWQQANSVHHLSKVYEICSGMLLHLKLLHGPPASPSGAETAAVGKRDTTQLIVQAASPPMRRLLGVTASDIRGGRLDMLDFVLEEDKTALVSQLRQPPATSEMAGTQKLVWRWVDATGASVPVVGSWRNIGEAGDDEIVLESTSLLPSMLLRREKELRIAAERKAEAAQRLTDQVRQEASNKQQAEVHMHLELKSMMSEIGEFSKMVTDNPSVLTWRIRVRDGRINFVSEASCLQVLGYKPDELVGKANADLLHPEDVDKMQLEISGNEHTTFRLRRFHKSGAVVVLESRAYAWWDEQRSEIIVTEYDITSLVAGG